MDKNNARIVMLIAALIGLAISTYLFYVYVMGGPIICGMNGYHGCDIVRASHWAYIGPIPRPALGIVYYAAFLGLLILAPVFKKRMKEYGWAVFAFALIGAIESAYLVGIQTFMIHAYCVWCLGSAMCAFVILGAELLTKKK
jgi:uncharacterized membrane protein